MRALVVVAALLSFAAPSLAAQPKESAGNPANAPNDKVATALENVATALKEQAKAPQREEPCTEGKNDRARDLCAQWKAADAAQQAANIALWIGIVGSLIGFFTLVAAVQAARFAKKAADHTEAGANTADRALGHQREIATHSHRAYLDFDDAKFSRWPQGDDEDGLGYKATLKLRNFGQTPAQKILVRVAMFRLDQRPSFQIVKSRALTRLNRVAPSDWANLRDVIALDGDAIEAIKEGHNCVWLLLQFFYSDIFGKRYEQGAIYALDADLEWALVEQHGEHEIKV